MLSSWSFCYGFLKNSYWTRQFSASLLLKRSTKKRSKYNMIRLFNAPTKKEQKKEVGAWIKIRNGLPQTY
jgi:hypothetical protein